MSTIELKKPLKIDVGGHPARIIWLAPSLERRLVSTDHPQKRIAAYVEFEPAVEGVEDLWVEYTVST